AVLAHERDLDDGRVERDPIAEEEQERQRQRHGDDPARWIARDLLGFFEHDRRELLPPASLAEPAKSSATTVRPRLIAGRRRIRRRHAAFRSTSAMKASSNVGSGRCALLALDFSSSGVPSAIFRPRQMRPIRSQYSASSMKCVVTTTATPLPVRALM